MCTSFPFSLSVLTSVAACTNNCWDHGTCNPVNSTCKCDVPWTGPDCGYCTGAECPITYCGKNFVYLSNTSGTFSDKSAPGEYLPNEDCTWTIAPPAGNWTSIVLIFTHFDLEYGAALLTIYDGSFSFELTSYTGENWIKIQLIFLRGND